MSFGSDTGAYFRKEMQAAFFAKYLKDKGDAPPEARDVPDRREQVGNLRRVAAEGGHAANAVLPARRANSASTNRRRPTASDEYVSDPANPVPYRPRPVTPTYPGPEWPVWMVEDQRFTHGRPDVLTYETDPLTEDVIVAGSMKAKLFGSTTGTDCDWIVRLIDVYPEDHVTAREHGGVPAAHRGRAGAGAVPQESGEAGGGGAGRGGGVHHRPASGATTASARGTRSWCRCSSTWFPVIDRNPQKFVPNIFEAEDADFQKATQKVFRTAKLPSGITLDVLPAK